MKHPAWLYFIKDVGDCLGGGLVGYALPTRNLVCGIVGLVFIALSLFLKHYYKK